MVKFRDQKVTLSGCKQIKNLLIILRDLAKEKKLNRHAICGQSRLEIEQGRIYLNCLGQGESLWVFHITGNFPFDGQGNC